MQFIILLNNLQISTFYITNKYINGQSLTINILNYFLHHCLSTSLCIFFNWLLLCIICAYFITKITISLRIYYDQLIRVQQKTRTIFHTNIRIFSINILFIIFDIMHLLQQKVDAVQKS